MSFLMPETTELTMRLQKALNEIELHQRSNGWSNAEVARRADVALSTYSEVKRGKYRGGIDRIVEKLEAWLRIEAERLETHSSSLDKIPFLMTSLSKKMLTAISLAHQKPAMVMLTLGAGLGKTETLRYYSNTYPYAYRVVIEPVEGKARAAIRKIGNLFGITGRAAESIKQETKHRLQAEQGRQCVLLIDEAQNLEDDAVNQLRFFLDEARCGIVLAGNEDLMARYALSASREGYGQIHRRVFMRVHEKVAPVADIDLMLDALKVDDKAIRRLCHVIGTKPGGLGQVRDTLDLAATLAYGQSRMMSAEDVRSAWQNRAREVI